MDHCLLLTEKGTLQTVPLLLALPQETVGDFEEKVTAKETKEWMADINNEVVTFVEELILAYGQTSSLLSRVQDMAEMQEDLQNIQDKVIPCLKVVKGIPKQELIDGQAIATRDINDFNTRNWALITRNEVLEKVKDDVVKIEELIQEIQNKIFLVVADALGKEAIRDNEMNVENLKVKVQGNFFTFTRSILKKNLIKAATFFSIRDAFQKQELDWENAFATYVEDLEMIEFKINMLPHVTMEEVNPLVSKFIECAATERRYEMHSSRRKIHVTCVNLLFIVVG